MTTRVQVGDAIAAVSVVASLLRFAYTRTANRDPQRILDLGLAYMVLTALAVTDVSFGADPPDAVRISTGLVDRRSHPDVLGHRTEHQDENPSRRRNRIFRRPRAVGESVRGHRHAGYRKHSVASGGTGPIQHAARRLRSTSRQTPFRQLEFRRRLLGWIRLALGQRFPLARRSSAVHEARDRRERNGAATTETASAPLSSLLQLAATRFPLRS
jgi:hypothetical protein